MAGREADAKPVLIAGGGIGGLSAAIALSRRGIPSVVLEADEQFSEAGAGIQIGPNGSRILLGWGLGDGLEQRAARPDCISIGDGMSGKQLASVPLGRQAERRYRSPYYVAERRLLHAMLLEKARSRSDIELITGFRVADLSTSDDDVAAISAGGETARGRALIGADGIHSRVRAHVSGGEPCFSGRNAWRATASLSQGGAFNDRNVHLWMGDKAHLVHYCCGRDGPLNAVAIVSGEAASPGWGTKGDATDLMRAFANWADEPSRLLGHFDGWMVWPLLSLAPLARWTHGRVALLGDAAHPLMPFLASGAVMAIEDSAVIAAELARRSRSVESALAAYEAKRRPRAMRVQQRSRRMGEIYHMRGAMRLARNLTLAALPDTALLRRNDWLYDYSADD